MITEREVLQARILAATVAMTIQFKNSGLSTAESAIVCRALEFAFKETGRLHTPEDFLRSGKAMSELISAEVDQLIAAREAQK